MDNSSKRFIITYFKDDEMVHTSFRQERPLIKECQEMAEGFKAQRFLIHDRCDPEVNKKLTKTPKGSWRSELVSAK